MSANETLYQIGICPNCPDDAAQQLLFAVDDSSRPIIERGELVAYELFETLSLFRCGGCGSTLMYTTESDFGGISVDELDRSVPSDVAKLGSTQFIELSTLVWPTVKEPATLPLTVPENVRRIYDEALKVKASSPDSFSVQIRRAIQAICVNKGAKEYDHDGRRLDLVDNLRDMSKSGVFPRHVTDVLTQLRYLGNTAAHSIDATVKPEIANIADELFRLLIQYIYEFPDKLAKLKQETQALRFEDEKRRGQGR